MTLLEAFGHEEGFNSPGTRPNRNNNPGDLEYHEWQKPFGAVPESRPDGSHGRFAHFPTPQQGFAALRHLLGFPMYRGKTIAQAVQIFAPPVENNTGSYVANLCKWTGLTPETVIDDHLG